MILSNIYTYFSAKADTDNHPHLFRRLSTVLSKSCGRHEVYLTCSWSNYRITRSASIESLAARFTIFDFPKKYGPLVA